MFVPRPPRWRARILYGLAFIGFLALSGLTLIIYAALQVPETNLEAVIPFPRLALPYEKIEAIPNVSAAAQAKPPSGSGEPAYAYFYTTPVSDPGQSQVKMLQFRPKPVKRAVRASKPKKSS
ncbi:MAG: hypothetical protein ACUVRZ_01465 [Desulfobacca sp.]|uniref:hypothetical protein n=1 Tax=Desulfobacca sp. TaxID=2067990 RepID=UPI004049B917